VALRHWPAPARRRRRRSLRPFQGSSSQILSVLLRADPWRAAGRHLEQAAGAKRRSGRHCRRRLLGRFQESKLLGALPRKDPWDSYPRDTQLPATQPDRNRLERVPSASLLPESLTSRSGSRHPPPSLRRSLVLSQGLIQRYGPLQSIWERTSCASGHQTHAIRKMTRKNPLSRIVEERVQRTRGRRERTAEGGRPKPRWSHEPSPDDSPSDCAGPSGRTPPLSRSQCFRYAIEVGRDSSYTTRT
jgi:hypothetical protein